MRRVASILVVASAGCSLFTSLDGFTGGAVDGGAPQEAGPSGGDGGTDAPVPPADAPTPDATAFTCEGLSPAPKLCVTFSNGVVYTGGPKTANDFEALTVRDASNPVLDNALMASPPAAARFDMAPPQTRTYVTRTFAEPTPAKLDVATSIRLDAPDYTLLDLLEVRFMGSVTNSIFLHLDPGGAASIVHGEQGVHTVLPLAKPMPQRQWVRIAMTILSSPAPRVSVTVDGTTVLDAALPSRPAPDGMTFVAGCTDGTLAANGHVWFDDYVASW